FFNPISCQQEMASKHKMGYKCRIAGVMLLLLTSIAALVAVAVIQDTWRLIGKCLCNNIFFLPSSSKENETGIVTETLNCKVDGESHITKRGGVTMAGFRKCMDIVTKTIPPTKHNSTRLFLGATAGMRLLQMKDAQRANNVLVKLRQYLSSLPFMFQNASVITGQEEGLYGWITVNYLMGNLVEKNVWNAYVRPQGAKTVGSMDLGGASTQIAFAVQDDLKGADYLRVKLYGYPYNVYTHSFLCYGKNEAGKLQSSNPKNITNPCYPKGFNTTRKASSIFESQCTKKPQNYDPNQELTFFGGGDSDSCGKVVKSIFDFKTCSSSQCSFNGVEQPPVTGDFLAYAGFFYTAVALQLNGTSNINHFNTSVRNFCHKNWATLNAQKNVKYIETHCYAGHYVFTLLADGYKFDTDTWKNINFLQQKTNIGWSLGYMLSMSNMIPSEVKKIPPLSNPVFAGLIFLFSALTIMTARESLAIERPGNCCNSARGSENPTVACAKMPGLDVNNQMCYYSG
uniref:Ectonucleoside triphosphate diphosphohydrolase 3 n=1 Tax=Neolamprologus brichardi TaxID=32507 RepID=A0A3Q4GNT1_NEOBR